MSTPTGHECDDVSANLSEFALGILTGRERSRVLEHVSTCIYCRSELDALALVSDQLLELAPLAEPSVGFENRLVQRWHDEVVPTPRPHLGAFALVAAALILIGGTFVVSSQLSSTTVQSRAHYGAALWSAPLTTHGKNRGQLWISQGDPAWVFMSLANVSESGMVNCRVTLRSGRVLNLGTFSLVAGGGSWATRVNVSGDSVRLAQITDATGRILASTLQNTRKV